MLCRRELAGVLIAVLGLALLGAANQTEVSFILRNLSGGAVTMYWLAPSHMNKFGHRLMVLQGPPCKNSTAMPINSFVGHEFIVRPSSNTPKSHPSMKEGEFLYEPSLEVNPSTHRKA